MRFSAALFFSIWCLAFPAFAQENPEELRGLVHYSVPKLNSAPVRKQLEAGEDDLYDGADIKPMEKQLSETEKQQENSSDLNYIDKQTQRPDLLCTDENLMQQIRDFILKSIQKKAVYSVLEKREQVLLIKNLHNLQEIKESEIKKEHNFDVSAALVNLKINEKREVYRICASLNNKSKKFKDIYIIIYPYINYYKVVVTNLMVVPEKMDEATFIYNW